MVCAPVFICAVELVFLGAQLMSFLVPPAAAHRLRGCWGRAPSIKSIKRLRGRIHHETTCRWRATTPAKRLEALKPVLRGRANHFSQTWVRRLSGLASGLRWFQLRPSPSSRPSRPSTRPAVAVRVSTPSLGRMCSMCLVTVRAGAQDVADVRIQPPPIRAGTAERRGKRHAAQGCQPVGTSAGSGLGGMVLSIQAMTARKRPANPTLAPMPALC